MKLGIFDSGIGGEAVAASLRVAFPTAEIVNVDDREHLPYGDRSPEDITALTDAAIQPLLAGNCDIIVIACNSATAAAIETLRARYPEQLFIGLEPMLKPAVTMTKSGTIAVCATPATLSSDHYARLKETYEGGVTILEPDCSTWARIIEDNEVNESHIEETVETVCSAGADVIVLACTHYHWIREVIERAAAGRADVIEPSAAIADRVRSLLESR
jgi:glutamate racemase